MNEMMQEIGGPQNLDIKDGSQNPNNFDARISDMKKMPEPVVPGFPPTDGNLTILLGVKLLVTVELGRAHLSVKEVLELQKGSVVELDRIAGEAVDIYVNDSLIARGDVVVVDDKFGVRVTELIPIEKSSL